MADLLSAMPARSEAALERERLVSLINSMADGVIAADEIGRVVLYNGAALGILDLNTSISGLPLNSLAPVIDKNNQPVDLSQLVLATKLPTSLRDLRIKYPDGSLINLYLSIAPVRLGFGQSGMKGYVLLLRDISREKSLEEERDEFISVISHELRTPIAIAEGNISNAEVIAGKTGNIDQIKDALTQAHDQINFLSGMINDLATLSRAERGRLSVEVEAVNAYDLINDLLKNYQPSAEDKGLVLRAEIAPNLELIKTSKLYLREILQNFITNAIKYTDKGSITLTASPQQGGIQFKVVDTGMGIGHQDQEKIFNKFFRGEDYRTKGQKGTGLGLYIAMKLAKLLRGQISLQSELNHGSTFTLYVPSLSS